MKRLRNEFEIARTLLQLIKIREQTKRSYVLSLKAQLELDIDSLGFSLQGLVDHFEKYVNVCLFFIHSCLFVCLFVYVCFVFVENVQLELNIDSLGFSLQGLVEF